MCRYSSSYASRKLCSTRRHPTGESTHVCRRANTVKRTLLLYHEAHAVSSMRQALYVVGRTVHSPTCNRYKTVTNVLPRSTSAVVIVSGYAPRVAARIPCYPCCRLALRVRHIMGWYRHCTVKDMLLSQPRLRPALFLYADHITFRVCIFLFKFIV